MTSLATTSAPKYKVMNNHKNKQTNKTIKPNQEHK